MRVSTASSMAATPGDAGIQGAEKDRAGFEDSWIDKFKLQGWCRGLRAEGASESALTMPQTVFLALGFLASMTI